MQVQAKVQYFNPNRVNSLNNLYECTLTNLSKKDAAALKKEGATVRDGAREAKAKDRPERENWGLFVIAKSNRPIPVVDSKKNPWKESILIGNDSVVNAVLRCHTSNKGTRVNIDAVQVIDLVSYEPSSVEEFEEVEGFVIEDDENTEDTETEEENDEIDDLFESEDD